MEGVGDENEAGYPTREPLLPKGAAATTYEAAAGIPPVELPSFETKATSGVGCQQRGTKNSSNTNGNTSVESLEVGAEEEALADIFGVDEIRMLWYLFQCLWPALVLCFLGFPLRRFTRVEWYLYTLGPNLLVFLLLLIGNGIKISDFVWKDFVPTLLWSFGTADANFAEYVILAFGFLLALLAILSVSVTATFCFKYGPKQAIKKECYWLQHRWRLQVRTNNHRQEADLEKQQEREALQQARLVTQIAA